MTPAVWLAATLLAVLLLLALLHALLGLDCPVCGWEEGHDDDCPRGMA